MFKGIKCLACLFLSIVMTLFVGCGRAFEVYKYSAVDFIDEIVEKGGESYKKRYMIYDGAHYQLCQLGPTGFCLNLTEQVEAVARIQGLIYSSLLYVSVKDTEHNIMFADATVGSARMYYAKEGFTFPDIWTSALSEWIIVNRYEKDVFGAKSFVVSFDEPTYFSDIVETTPSIGVSCDRSRSKWAHSLLHLSDESYLSICACVFTDGESYYLSLYGVNSLEYRIKDAWQGIFKEAMDRYFLEYNKLHA